jgi:hypothetical protein
LVTSPEDVVESYGVLHLQLGGVVGGAAGRLEVVAQKILFGLGQALTDQMLEQMLEHVEAQEV